VLSGRGLCDEMITRPEESYRLCCVVVCDLETSGMGAPYIYDISRLRVKDIPRTEPSHKHHSKVCRCVRHKTSCKNGGIAPHILNLGTGWWGASFQDLAALPAVHAV